MSLNQFSGRNIADRITRVPMFLGHNSIFNKFAENRNHSERCLKAPSSPMNGSHPSVTGTELALSSHHSSLVTVGSLHFPRQILDFRFQLGLLVLKLSTKEGQQKLRKTLPCWLKSQHMLGGHKEVENSQGAVEAQRL